VIAEAEQQLVYGIEHILAIANDAKLEGAIAAIDATSLIATADTLLRIGFLAGNIKSLPNEYSVIRTRQYLESMQRTCAFWFEYLRTCTDSGVLLHAPLRAMVQSSRDAGLYPIRSAVDDVHPGYSLISSQSEVDSADRVRRLLQANLDKFERQITHVARDDD
jgi:hypothetical protein